MIVDLRFRWGFSYLGAGSWYDMDCGYYVVDKVDSVMRIM